MTGVIVAMEYLTLGNGRTVWNGNIANIIGNNVVLGLAVSSFLFRFPTVLSSDKVADTSIVSPSPHPTPPLPPPPPRHHLPSP